MKKFHSNLAFVDLLFNLLTGFVTLFIIAFLLIQPPTEDGKTDPRVEFMIVSSWDKFSPNDIDLWVEGPDKQVVAYTSREGSYMNLSRDDLGIKNDYVTVNGKSRIIQRNMEDVQVRSIVPGDYIVNVHFFAKGRDEKALREDKQLVYPKTEEVVTVVLMDLSPNYKVIIEVEVELVDQAERTAFIFTVDEKGNVVDIRTDLQVSIRGSWGGGENTP